MSDLKKILLTALFPLCILLGGCGNRAASEELAGKYVLTGARDESLILSAKTVEEQEVSLRLDPNGSGVLIAGEDSGRIYWSASDGRITLQAGEVLLEGGEENGALIFHDGEGAVLRFEQESLTDAAESDEAPARGRNTGEPAVMDAGSGSAEAFFQDFLGDWYGWWKIEDSQGTMPVSWYDCCAALAEQEDGALRMLLWDENGSRDEPLADVRLVRAEHVDGSEASGGDVSLEESPGALCSLDGYFLFQEIREGDWVLEKPEPALVLTDVSHDGNGEVFRCSFFLRPWGDDWKDAPEEQRPFYFDDWYLPLVKENAPMPDAIPWEMLEKAREE